MAWHRRRSVPWSERVRCTADGCRKLFLPKGLAIHLAHAHNVRGTSKRKRPAVTFTCPWCRATCAYYRGLTLHVEDVHGLRVEQHQDRIWRVN